MESIHVKTTSRGKIFVGIIGILLIALFYIGITWLIDKHNYISTEDAKITGNIITVRPRIIGKISAIKVKEGDTVKKGDVLFILDTEEPIARIKQAQAALDMAQAQLNKAVGGARSQEITEAQSLVDQANASYNGVLYGMDSIKSSLSTAQNTYNTINKQMYGFKNPKTKQFELSYAMKKLNILYVTKKVTDAQYTVQAQGIQQLFLSKAQMEGQITQMKGQIKALNAAINASKAGLAGANSRLKLVAEGASTKDIAILVNAVKVAKASLEVTKLSLSYANIKAPMDGTVLQLTANVGDVVAPGSSTMSLVDFTKLKATAYISENELEKVLYGQSVKLSLDAFPGKAFEGKISKVGLATTSAFQPSEGDNSSRSYTKVCQRVPVTIDFNYKGTPVLPGMSVNTKIKLASQKTLTLNAK